jgi:lysozyme family protein
MKNTKLPQQILLVDDSLPLVASKAISRILEEEGGYTCNSADKGGETKFGISSRWYPHIDVKNLTSINASKIYYRDYWRFNNCHKLPQDIALVLFDTAVNQGGTFARKALQQALNIKQDGIVGSKTIAAAYAAPSLFLITKLTRIRCQHYTNLVQKDYSQITFIEGWIDRALDILIECQMITVSGENNE